MNNITEFKQLDLQHPDYKVRLYENPLLCSCRMKWLKESIYSSHYVVDRCLHALTRIYVQFDSMKEDEFLCEITVNCPLAREYGCLCYTINVKRLSEPTLLICSNRNITQFPGVKPSSVTIAHFDGNNFASFGYESSTERLTLKELYMRDSFISELSPTAFVSFPGLVVLCLERNKITYLWKETFAKIGKLVKLDLSKNSIVQIEPGSFLDLRNLNILQIHKNSLEALSNDTMEEIISLGNLQTLTLYNNSWRCKCNNGTFKNWLLRFKGEVLRNVNDIRCNDTVIKYIPDKRFSCDNPQPEQNEYFIAISPATLLVATCLVLIPGFSVSCRGALASSHSGSSVR